jgi:hypothetical protein
MHNDEQLKAIKRRLSDKLWGPAVQGVDVFNNDKGDAEFTVIVDAQPADLKQLPQYVEGYKINYRAGRIVKQ